MSTFSGISRPYSQEYWVNLPRGEKAKISEAAGISRVHAWAVFNKRWKAAPQTVMDICEATRGEIQPEQIITDRDILRLGIDPGVSTGYAAINRERHTIVTIGLLRAASRPILGKGKWFDIEEFIGVMNNLSGHNHVIAFVEVPVLMPGKGMKTIAMQFETLGVIRSILYIRRIPVNWVIPSVWKRKAGLLKKDKEASVQLAKTLYPGLHMDINHDSAESLLIAHFGV